MALSAHINEHGVKDAKEYREKDLETGGKEKL